MIENGIKIIADNRKASFDYFLRDRYEAGIVLSGTEIKSIRNHSINIKDAYVTIKNDEAWIINMNIANYKEGNIFNLDPVRSRKLLLHKKEIRHLKVAIKEEGFTLIPTKVYLSKGKAKMEFAIAEGKHLYDKREDAKNKSMDKEARKTSRERY